MVPLTCRAYINRPQAWVKHVYRSQNQRGCDTLFSIGGGDSGWTVSAFRMVGDVALEGSTGIRARVSAFTCFAA